MAGPPLRGGYGNEERKGEILILTLELLPGRPLQTACGCLDGVFICSAHPHPVSLVPVPLLGRGVALGFNLHRNSYNLRLSYILATNRSSKKRNYLGRGNNLTIVEDSFSNPVSNRE